MCGSSSSPRRSEELWRVNVPISLSHTPPAFSGSTLPVTCVPCPLLASVLAQPSSSPLGLPLHLSMHEVASLFTNGRLRGIEKEQGLALPRCTAKFMFWPAVAPKGNARHVSSHHEPQHIFYHFTTNLALHKQPTWAMHFSLC